MNNGDTTSNISDTLVKHGEAKLKTKSKRQVGYLLSNDSPLNPTQKNKLKSELHTGAVKVAG